jgi:type VI secretion system protein ImpK
MREELANVVYPVIQQGLGLKDKLQRGESLDLKQQQANLRGLLQSEALNGDNSTAEDRFLGIRYALVSWLDEIFILYTPASADWWEAHGMEWEYFRTNDRAFKFWEQAARAEALGSADALEVFFLCVVLGFRGDYVGSPDRVKAWRDPALSQISRSRAEFPLPVALQPPTNVPPLEGARRLQGMLVAWAVSLLVLVPAIVFLLLYQLRK